MNIRIPQSGKAAKLAKEFLQSQGLAASHQQCLELVARLHGYQDWHAMQGDKRFEHKPALKAVSSDEYELNADTRSAWVQVDNITVYVRRDDEGVSVDLYPVGQEDAESLAGAWLTFGEAEEAARPHEHQAWLQYDKHRDAWYWSARKVPSLTAPDLVVAQFDGKRETDWAGAFTDHEDAVEAAVARLGDDTRIDWVRSDAPREATCSVLQDNGEYMEDLTLHGALKTARDIRDSGVGGTWTVETEDGELIAIYR